MLLGIVMDSFAYNDSGDGKIVIIFWTFYNLLVLGVTMIVCIELPRREIHLGDKPERAVLHLQNGKVRVWIVGLTQNSVRIRGRRYLTTCRSASRSKRSDAYRPS